MSRARIVLHLAALLAPFAAVALWSLVLFHDDLSHAIVEALAFGAAAALAAQIAAALRWRALERRARENRGGWQTGIGMAAITHVLFGVFVDAALVFATGWTASMGTGKPTDLIAQVIFFTLISLTTVGLITFPFTALVAQWVAGLRRRELADVAR